MPRCWEPLWYLQGKGTQPSCLQPPCSVCALPECGLSGCPSIASPIERSKCNCEGVKSLGPLCPSSISLSWNQFSGCLPAEHTFSTSISQWNIPAHLKPPFFLPRSQWEKKKELSAHPTTKGESEAPSLLHGKQLTMSGGPPRMCPQKRSSWTPYAHVPSQLLTAKVIRRDLRCYDILRCK